MDPSDNPLLDWAEVSLAEVRDDEPLVCDRCGIADDVRVRDDCPHPRCEPQMLCGSCSTHRWAECAEKHAVPVSWGQP